MAKRKYNKKYHRRPIPLGGEIEFARKEAVRQKKDHINQMNNLALSMKKLMTEIQGMTHRVPRRFKGYNCSRVMREQHLFSIRKKSEKLSSMRDRILAMKKATS